MFVKKVKNGGKFYYYMARKSGQGKIEILANLGRLETASANQEDELVVKWARSALRGVEAAGQKDIAHEKALHASKVSEQGKDFDMDKLMRELGAIKKKYGKLSKQLLEKRARPNGELSWGVSTVLNNLRRRGMSLKECFGKLQE